MKFFAIIPFLFSLFFLSNCKSGCQKIICRANQNCNQGSCYCINGYQGGNCDSLSYYKYIGNYSVTEACNQASGGMFYPAIQHLTSDPSELTITSFLGAYQFVANITSNANADGNYVYIKEQGFDGVSGDYIQGDGTFNKQTQRLTLTINYHYQNTDKACTQYWQKIP